ncbi:predicted protein [Micromonas commoda]|uniref:AIG1-type G domain-containing protein n=1 Tax=Micromonas commoda (strain RCC299 / NOUM17 / CCMP2709) TaxID=296587 RepID=C1E3B2_MICCC|nr:predicted protein [Micromonas commoda]ACO62903.1 predicted protein [Micromonas commoda]|eukprot:XP_002501645.1 predicted protein [Micromonas commoda]
MAPTRLTVVLVGQTGNGKSATGNSLLGRDAFVARRSLKSVTERCRVRYAALDADDEPIVPGDPAVGVDEDAGGIRRPSTVLRVVDTPGTCDSGALLEDNLRHISAFLRGEERVDESTADDDDDDGAEAGAGDEGLHALVLVLSAATRFTQEEAVALERLVQRLGEGVMRHSVAIFTRGGELAADDVRVDDFVRSAPPTLRQLLARMGHHADGTPPILVENVPRDGSSRAATARAPLLTAVRELVKRVAAERRCDPNQATYDAKALTAASHAADADPSTAALAVLDKLKRQMASGPMAAGGGGGADPRRSAMAEAAMRAFSDLQAQFAARAGAGSVAAPAVPPPGCGVFGGFGASSVGDRVTDRVVDREWMEWTNALADGGDGDAAGGPSLTVGLRGAGDVHADTACAVHFAGGTCLLRFRAPVECGDGKDPVARFRSSGRVSAVGDGGFIVSASAPVGSNAADAPAVTFHSPVFLQGPCHYAPTNPIVTDDDWVEEGVYKCELAPCADPFPAPFAKYLFTDDDDDDEPPTHGRLDGPRVVCMLRGVKPGDAVNVRAVVGRKGTRFELQGGSMSLRACDFAMKPLPRALRSRESTSVSFAVDGVLDLTPGVNMALGAPVSQDPTENTTVQIPKGFEWPWKRGEPGRKPGQGDPSK